MSLQLVPDSLLQKSDKILFIAHLALGDYAYLQNYFREFAKAYPHIKIHLWVDELRRTRDPAKWDGLKNYVLYDWLEACPFFEKVYRRTYNPTVYRESILEAQKQDYPIVVSLATLRPHLYARLARNISPNGYIVGMKKPFHILGLHHPLAYRKLNAVIPLYTLSKTKLQHITEIYADWFFRLFGLKISPKDRFPFVDIPIAWMEQAESYLTHSGIDRIGDKLVFINAYAKIKKRSWGLVQVAELIMAMQKTPVWRDAWFLINAMPEDVATAKKVLSEYQLKQVKFFSADKNFFQLPALLSLCDLIISVETAVMHLANAVHVPVVALMRRTSPEWAPIDQANSTVITAEKRNDWVKEISVTKVLASLPQ